MNWFKDSKADLEASHQFGNANKWGLFFFNRGFHALLFYRLAHSASKMHIPLLPFVLTRIIQILYAIDIDYKAKIAGGIVIVHGVGLVIGSGAQIESNVILFHGVTLGRRGIGAVISATDGFPIVQKNCTICAGAKLIGKIVIGQASIIGANCVVSESIAPNSICKIRKDNNIIYPKN
ncbi:serine O-acetyltransferase [Mucilaginibacter sp. Mucisp86]|uniref:serine O-acetyltransferase n=1 Tax=Mucilaginibacter sp. Mucisp86 TaxID=3243060 RepID=UPI0039B4B0E1